MEEDKKTDPQAPLCRQCQQPKNLYVDGLCYDCAMLDEEWGPNAPAKPDPTANHCVEHPVYQVETHPVAGGVVFTTPQGLLQGGTAITTTHRLSTREAKPTWLHSPSLCDKGGCPECEIVSDK